MTIYCQIERALWYCCTPGGFIFAGKQLTAEEIITTVMKIRKSLLRMFSYFHEQLMQKIWFELKRETLGSFLETLTAGIQVVLSQRDSVTTNSRVYASLTKAPIKYLYAQLKVWTQFFYNWATTRVCAKKHFLLWQNAKFS